MVCDCSGYATKANIRCSDGRIILTNAFKHNDGATVPLVWHHMRDSVDNVLGKAVLENRPDGVYAYCTFNDTESGQNAKALVMHGDITSLSIYANHLKQRGNAVEHGEIREVSLVYAGANPGARIDNLSINHGDGYEDIEDEVIIYSGDNFTLEDKPMRTRNASFSHEDNTGSEAGKTVREVFESFSEEQKNVVYAMIAAALEEADDEEEGDDGDMGHNVFENDVNEGNFLSHDEQAAIFSDAQKCGSLKESFLAHAQSYGIENIEILFPDAKTVTNTPDFVKRETDWVAGVISGVHHSPFSRIKSTAADITADEARAKGYVKGNLKKEEVIKVLKRVTTPTTIYKKQKLDRDDIVDITDFDVVAWLKQEMRIMLDEEIARAILVGDGREADDEDKINEEHVRPIWKEDDMYAHHVTVQSSTTTEDLMESIIRAMEVYEGSGSPALYTTQGFVTDMLLLKDKVGRRIYETETSVANALGVSKIVKVPVMKNLTRTVDGQTRNLFGIIVNLKDYYAGADKGGHISMFDDFDIDYNRYKYLMETRMSGALVHPKSAIVIEFNEGSTSAAMARNYAKSGDDE